MQTFLPYPDFRQSAAALDTARLGKQRVEALQTLRALVIPEYGWQTHPAVRMWMGYVPALTMYGLAMVDEWTERGHPDNTRANITEFAPQAAHPDYAAKIPMPPWLGNSDFHLSHRSKLLRKEPKFYKTVFPDAVPDIDYIWPEPKHEFLPEDPEGDILWILRSPHEEFSPETLNTVALPPVRRALAAAEQDDYSPVYADDGSRRPSKQPRKLPPKAKVKKPTRKRQAQEEAFATPPGQDACGGFVRGRRQVRRRPGAGPAHHARRRPLRPQLQRHRGDRPVRVRLPGAPAGPPGLLPGPCSLTA